MTKGHRPRHGGRCLWIPLLLVLSFIGMELLRFENTDGPKRGTMVQSHADNVATVATIDASATTIPPGHALEHGKVDDSTTVAMDSLDTKDYIVTNSNSKPQSDAQLTPQQLQYRRMTPDLVGKDGASMFLRSAVVSQEPSNHHVADANNNNDTGTSMLHSQQHRWYPTREWLQNCTIDQTPLAVRAGPFRNPWKEMVLGDCIKNCNCYQHPVGTFNDLYDQMYCQHLGNTGTTTPAANFSVMDDIHRLQSRRPPQEGFIQPHPNTLVVHLRLGDVVENAVPENLVDILWEGGDPGHKRRAGRYPKAIKSASELLENVYDTTDTGRASNVHIVGGSHKVDFYLKSRVYAGCLQQVMLAAGYHDTQLTVEGVPAEQDFYYISHARQLVVSAGGYSNLMGQLASRRGATIVGRSFGVHWSNRKNKGG